jgi:uncharacterized protein YjiS (DUF1127 family)
MAMVLVQGSRNPKVFLAQRARLSDVICARVIAIGRRRFAWPIHRFSAWRQDAASRRCLATLNEYYLKDIGLTRHDMAPDSCSPSRLW